MIKDYLLLPSRFLFGVYYENELEKYEYFKKNIDEIFEYIASDDDKKAIKRELVLLKEMLTNIDNDVLTEIYLDKIYKSNKRNNISFYEYKISLERILGTKIDDNISIFAFKETEKAAIKLMNEQKST
jgi:hypothetical protein